MSYFQSEVNDMGRFETQASEASEVIANEEIDDVVFDIEVSEAAKVISVMSEGNERVIVELVEFGTIYSIPAEEIQLVTKTETKMRGSLFERVFDKGTNVREVMIKVESGVWIWFDVEIEKVEDVMSNLETIQGAGERFDV